MGALNDRDPDPTPAEWRLRSPHSWRWDVDQFELDFGDEPESEWLDLPPLTTHQSTTTIINPHSGRPVQHTIYTNRTIKPEEATMYDPTSDSDLDRRDIEQVAEAEAILDGYLPGGNMRHVISFDRAVHDLCIARRLDYSDTASGGDRDTAIGIVQNVLKERCVNKDLRLGEVYLDTEGVEPQDNRKWMNVDLSKIVFTKLTAADQVLRKLTNDARFIAVYWSADDAPIKYVEDKYTGEPTARRDGFARQAYLGIVGVWQAEYQAIESMQELRQAVDQIAKYRTGSALEDDPVRDAISDANEPRLRMDAC